MRKLQASGKTVIIYSDYPVKEKLDALSFTPDYSFWSGDGFIECMKPDSSGIARVIDSLGFDRVEILYVGDRYGRDGLCAEGTGIDYMDVKEFVKKI
ncbi:MAG: HAD family hydrolase [Synergistaceae bacterium]|nr:HAD family hydrolase [Synergistaceae bacterium]MBQ4431085.1 HAD family hydrolase [Synergistaceae bacterium]MBQ6970875.1 HAD family hydrolase [Synergistaceae bacterium]